VQTLAERLALLGHESVVVSQESDEAEPLLVDRVRGVKVYRFRRKGLPPRRFTERMHIRHMARLVVRREGLDVFESFADHGLFMTGRLGCPLVVRLHSTEQLCRHMTGEPANRSLDWFERRLLEIADVRVGVSTWLARTIMALAGLPTLPYRVVYNGVDTSRFHVASPPATRRGLMLFSGRLTERKGLPALFAAMPEVMLRYPEVALRCVGNDASQPGYPSRLAERYLSTLPLELRSRVEFTGPIRYEQIHEEYQKAELFVLPSLIEGHPLVVLEAMACGVPAVFSREGVGPEVITNDEDGFLCDVRNPQELADTICHALDRCRADPGIRDRARHKVESKFSLTQAVAANVALYEEVIQGGHRA
jgi:glycosyltransferase involved in cell wall biosynthesis